MAKPANNIIVICGVCGTTARLDMDSDDNPYGTYHWDEPCRKCGAIAYVAHDTARDWISGRLLPEYQDH